MTQCAYPKCRERDELTTVESGRNGKPYAYCDEHLPDVDGDRWEVVDGDA